MSDVATLTIEQVQSGLAARKFSAVELAKSALEFAQAENPKTNAYLTFCPERALSAAARVDNKLAAGEDPGALARVTISLKDASFTPRLPPPCRSCPLVHYCSPYNATAVVR